MARLEKTPKICSMNGADYLPLEKRKILVLKVNKVNFNNNFTINYF